LLAMTVMTSPGATVVGATATVVGTGVVVGVVVPVFCAAGAAVPWPLTLANGIAASARVTRIARAVRRLLIWSL
jgi:hypothetical protein